MSVGSHRGCSCALWYRNMSLLIGRINRSVRDATHQHISHKNMPRSRNANSWVVDIKRVKFMFSFSQIKTFCYNRQFLLRYKSWFVSSPRQFSSYRPLSILVLRDTSFLISWVMSSWCSFRTVYSVDSVRMRDVTKSSTACSSVELRSIGSIELFIVVHSICNTSFFNSN